MPLVPVPQQRMLNQVDRSAHVIRMTEDLRSPDQNHWFPTIRGMPFAQPYLPSQNQTYSNTQTRFVNEALAYAGRRNPILSNFLPGLGGVGEDIAGWFGVDVGEIEETGAKIKRTLTFISVTSAIAAATGIILVARGMKRG